MLYTRFSPNDGLFAVSDGSQVVAVWDTSSSKLVCRISKPDWATVKTLSWSCSIVNKTNRKRKKRNVSSVSEGASPILAIGGDHGVSLWDVQRNEELYATSMAELDSVCGIAWAGEDVLYICDGSPHVIEWNKTESNLEKWKCDKRGVCCLCVSSDANVLVTAGRTIKTWNTADHTLLQKLSGHISTIIDMTFLSPSLISTVAENDRNVCIWDISSNESGTFVCESSAKEVTSSSSGSQIKASVVCEEGIHMFVMEGDISEDSKPMSPTTTVQIKSKQSLHSFPLLSAITTSSGDLLLAHTSHIKPRFETIPFSHDQSRVCLERDVPKGLLLVDQSKQSSNTTKQSNPVPVMGTGTPQIVWEHLESNKVKKVLEDVPMADRLKALDINMKKENMEQKKVHLTAESLSVLVIQSVHSGDKTMLEEVLQESNKENVINGTIRNLPVTAVVPFLKTLIDLLQTRPSRGPILSLWIRSILLLHTAYLLTVPHLLNSLSALYQSMESRTTTCTKLNRLRGKLDLLLAQSSSVVTGNGLSHQLALLNKPLLSVTAGSSALTEDNQDDDRDDEYDVALFQSDEEEGDDNDSSCPDEEYEENSEDQGNDSENYLEEMEND